MEPRSKALALVSVTLVLLAACQESGVGRPCCTAGPGAGTDCVNGEVPLDPGAGTNLSGNDLKCATRACVYVQPQACEGGSSPACETALRSRRAECTERCAGDGDCPEGFLCARPLVVGDEYRCEPVCVRREFLPTDPRTGEPIATPAACAGPTVTGP